MVALDMGVAGLARAQPFEVRQAIRDRRWRASTAGLALGYAQANLVVVRGNWADEFRQFCLHNSRACPLLDATAPGSPRPLRLAAEADVRVDVPGYRLFHHGRLEEREDLLEEWGPDVVAFLLGCSFSFERALMAAGIGIRHLEVGCNVPMYITRVACKPTQRLHGPLVVSMRPVARDAIEEVQRICAEFPGAHGEPVHVGDPSYLGISDLDNPDFGDRVPIHAGETPVFWACGVTPQVVLAESGCPWFAAHKPGHMFISDCEESILPLTSQWERRSLGSADIDLQ